MNLKLLLFACMFFVIDGFIIKCNLPLLHGKSNNKPLLLANYGGNNGNNNIINSGGNGNNDDDDINLFISLMLLNICMIKTTYKNFNLFDLIFYNNK